MGQLYHTNCQPVTWFNLNNVISSSSVDKFSFQCSDLLYFVSNLKCGLFHLRPMVLRSCVCNLLDFFEKFLSLMNNAKLILAVFFTTASCSDLQKICLTGKRPADGGDQKRAPSNSTQRDNRGLPLIVAPSYTNKFSTEKVTQKELIISLDDKKEKRIDDDKNRTAPVLSTASSFPTVQPKQGSLHRIQEKPVSTSARGRSKDEDRLFHRERIRLPKFQWTEHHVKNKKVVSQERGVEATNGEKRDVKQPEFISTSDSDDSVPRQLTSRGSLRLGSNVQCRKSVSKKTPSHVSLSKCEVYSSTLPNAGERLQKYSQTGTRRSDETAFIQIFGQQTGPPPKVANKARTKVTEKDSSSRKAKSVSNQNLPLHCLTKFGRSNFHHVLEARSFKPGERKLGATAVADFRS